MSRVKLLLFLFPFLLSSALAQVLDPTATSPDNVFKAAGCLIVKWGTGLPFLGLLLVVGLGGYFVGKAIQDRVGGDKVALFSSGGGVLGLVLLRAILSATIGQTCA
ncbi:hypothetical protein [Deinococcus petrolearius]|uniref:Conjugal transfer protein TrbC n=1 Tax=Deinococcus petrolearius TaxID=1751295 RepID=A0ABW1DPU2_9DEIO